MSKSTATLPNVKKPMPLVSISLLRSSVPKALIHSLSNREFRLCTSHLYQGQLSFFAELKLTLSVSHNLTFMNTIICRYILNLFPLIVEKMQRYESLFYLKNRMYSLSKLGVNTPLPMFSKISSCDQKRPSDNSSTSGLITPS